MKFFTSTKLSENMRETPEGYLVCLNVPIARTGDMVYMRGELPEIEADNEGKIIVSRDATEVFRPETIASFEAKSLTLWHPTEFVKPGNWSVVTKGVLQNVRRGTGANENDLLADLLVTDKRAIELIKNGLREVSCGYEADYIQTGIGRAVQKNIIGNHLAMVDEGRAGSTYAIMDHKGKGNPMTLSQKIKVHFEKAQEEALKLVAEGDGPAPIKTSDSAAIEGILKAVSTLTEKVEALTVPKKKVKDASTQPSQSQPAMVSASDEEVAGSLEDRLKKLEAMVSKLMEGMSTADSDEEEKPKKKEKGEDEDSEESESEDESSEDADSDESEDEDGEESEDADSDESEESEDADAEVAATVDSKSRIEILAPGMRAAGKDAKAKALKVCYATKDGKAVIEKFTGGKVPNFKDNGFVNMVFVAASEILKHTRSDDFSRTKTSDVGNYSSFAPKGAMTAEALNKKMADHYSGKH